jgi:hypothetical protein
MFINTGEKYEHIKTGEIDTVTHVDEFNAILLDKNDVNIVLPIEDFAKEYKKAILTPTKYTWLEAQFGEWQWVRKMSKQFWVKTGTGKNTVWIKYSEFEIKNIPRLLEILDKRNFIIEDWRVK